MKRRDFLNSTALAAVAVSTTGFIRFNGHNFTGDCETTTDILGPFYRPGSPVRNTLLIKGEGGVPIELYGIIKHNDCSSPYKNAKVELWHCNNDGVYDNTTDEFRYRGTTHTDDKGLYSFNTILPVPYDAGGGLVRPAHFHMMITAEGYQPLVTQLYFTGDKNIMNDAAAASPTAERRILKVENLNNGSKKVNYDVSMASSLAVEAVALKKLTGSYTSTKDPKGKKEFFIKDNQLWLKNEVFGEMYEYVGHNKFEYPGMPPGSYSFLQFEILATGAVQLTMAEAYGTYKSPAAIFLNEP